MPTLDEAAVSACVEAGAVGCLNQDQSPSQLIDRIKRAHAGEVPFAPDMLVNLLLQPRRDEADRWHSVQLLGVRELQVLEMLANGMSTEVVAARLGITVHTVRTHLKDVMAKLQVHSKLEAVMVAIREGLIAFLR